MTGVCLTGTTGPQVSGGLQREEEERHSSSSAADGMRGGCEDASRRRKKSINMDQAPNRIVRPLALS